MTKSAVLSLTSEWETVVSTPTKKDKTNSASLNSQIQQVSPKLLRLRRVKRRWSVAISSESTRLALEHSSIPRKLPSRRIFKWPRTICQDYLSPSQPLSSFHDLLAKSIITINIIKVIDLHQSNSPEYKITDPKSALHHGFYLKSNI